MECYMSQASLRHSTLYIHDHLRCSSASITPTSSAPLLYRKLALHQQLLFRDFTTRSISSLVLRLYIYNPAALLSNSSSYHTHSTFQPLKHLSRKPATVYSYRNDLHKRWRYGGLESNELHSSCPSLRGDGPKQPTVIKSEGLSPIKSDHSAITRPAQCIFAGRFPGSGSS